MTDKVVMSVATFESLTPYWRGYYVYMCGKNDEQPNIPDEKNPYPAQTAEHDAWNEGASKACFDVLDGDDE